jgi:prephenate dehydrogenase
MSAGAGDDAAFDTVAIVGVGLIGGSLGMALRRACPRIRLLGVDRASVVDAARARGAIDEGGDDLSLVREADLVVLAAPVGAIVQVLQSLGPCLRDGAVVTDTGSTKAAIVQSACGLPASMHFVGGHPVAGRAESGIEAASADLFSGRRWLLTPGSRLVPDEIIERLWLLIRSVGARPELIGAAEHDRVMASLSHVPQIVASVLMSVVGRSAGDDTLRLAGQGLLDMTRLAASEPALWNDIVRTNRDAISTVLDDFEAALATLRAELDAGGGIGSLFTEAARWRTVLVAAGGSPTMLRQGPVERVAPSE